MSNEFDANLDRWIISSIAKYFNDICTVDFMAEDQVRDTAALSSWVELRINGPNIREWSKDVYTINLEVDLLISVRASESNIYLIHELAGIFESSCDNIPVYKYGDDDSYLFCLPLDSGMVSNIKKLYYGKADDTKIKRASVMAFYEVETTLLDMR